MENLEHLLGVFEEVVELVYSSELEPSRARTDWATHRTQVDELAERYEQGLLPALDAVKGELDERILLALENRAGFIGLGVAAALQASGQSGRALPLLAVIADRTRQTESAAVFAAASRDPDSALEFAHLRHRLANGFVTARPELKKFAKKTREKALAAEALEMFHAPQPLTGAPGLSTLNGFGTGLYGSRDRDSSDGSIIKTLCLSALYIPVFPLKSYRVIDHGDGSYSFMSKNRLSGFARGYQKFLAAAIVLLVGYWAVSGYLNSPGRLAGKDLAAANTHRDAGRADEALSAYEALASKWAGRGNDSTIARAAKSALELRIAKVPAPLIVADVDDAAAVVRAYRGYPLEAHSSDNTALLEGKLLAWADELGTADATAMNAAISLLGERFSETQAVQTGPISERRGSLQTALATLLAPRRPIEALATFAELDARPEILALLEKIKDNPSLLREAAPVITSLNGIPPELHEAITAAMSVLDDEARTAALVSGDPAALGAALVAFPGDHDILAELAELDRASGKSDQAIARLEKIGEPGWLSGRAQQTLASAYADIDELERADELLSELLRYRLAGFRAAASAYYAAGDRIRDRLMNEADRGSAPANVMAAIRSENAEEAQAAFAGWVADEMKNDASLGELKRHYEGQVYVVPASITLGTIKLRRANAVGGEAREALLGQAEAAFLAIGDDAVGLPSYHLGLGQVYHRLGKTSEGDAEFQGLLDRGEPELGLQVSRAYRELGLTQRAIEVGEKVYAESSSPLREAAAHQLSFIVDDLDEKEEWLKKSDNTQPSVKISLIEVQAQRAAERGEEEEAAALFRKAAAHYERDAEHNSVAANNAAISYLEIYSVTGDAKFLVRARKGLEASLRLEPGNALVVSNLASHCDFEGWLEVISRYVPTEPLRLERSDVYSIAKLLVAGDLRDKVIADAQRNAILRRGRDLTSQEIVLGPSRTNAWERAAGWAEMTRDTAALKSLGEQLARVKLDNSRRDETRVAWETGASDEAATTEFDANVVRLEAMVAEAKKTKSKPAEAVSRVLLGGTLGQRAWFTSNIEDAKSGFDHLTAASALWPSLGDTSSSVALSLAFLRGISASDVLAKLRDDSWRRLNPTTILGMALQSTDADAVRAAIGKDSDLSAAVRAVRAAGLTSPGLTVWVLGSLAGDAELVAAAEAAFAAPHKRGAAAIDVTIDPGSADASWRAKLYETKAP